MSEECLFITCCICKLNDVSRACAKLRCSFWKWQIECRKLHSKNEQNLRVMLTLKLASYWNSSFSSRKGICRFKMHDANFKRERDFCVQVPHLFAKFKRLIHFFRDAYISQSYDDTRVWEEKKKLKINSFRHIHDITVSLHETQLSIL